VSSAARRGGALLAAAAVLLLTACSTDAFDPPPPPIVRPTVAPVESVFDARRTTVATGTLTGAVRGTVRIVGTSDTGFEITVRATAVTGPTTRRLELATSLADADCPTENDGQRSRSIDFGAYPLDHPITRRFPALEAARGDLSYMQVLTLAETGSDHYCDPDRMGIAQLHWTRSPALAGLHAVDSGATLAAAGTVRSRDGRPVAYEVATDDQLAAVARRLGLTPDEVLYLNPRRTRGDSRTLYYDETLNLDPDGR
jgi:hypothetical protein